MPRFIAALLLAACALTGCLSERVIENTRVPEIEIDASGAITFNGDPVKLGKVAAAIRSAGFRREQEINIRVPERVDPVIRNALCAELVRSGYTRTIFVKERKASATVKQRK
jgi:biopolymer transport protein ExbD